MDWDLEAASHEEPLVVHYAQIVSQECAFSSLGLGNVHVVDGIGETERRDPGVLLATPVAVKRDGFRTSSHPQAWSSAGDYKRTSCATLLALLLLEERQVLLVALGGQLLRGHEPEGRGVHAVPQARGRGPVL